MDQSSGVIRGHRSFNAMELLVHDRLPSSSIQNGTKEHSYRIAKGVLSLCSPSLLDPASFPFQPRPQPSDLVAFPLPGPLVFRRARSRRKHVSSDAVPRTPSPSSTGRHRQSPMQRGSELLGFKRSRHRSRRQQQQTLPSSLVCRRLDGRALMKDTWTAKVGNHVQELVHHRV